MPLVIFSMLVSVVELTSMSEESSISTTLRPFGTEIAPDSCDLASSSSSVLLAGPPIICHRVKRSWLAKLPKMVLEGYLVIIGVDDHGVRRHFRREMSVRAELNGVRSVMRAWFYG